MNTLFDEVCLNQDLKIVRLNANYNPSDDSCRSLKRLIDECENLYPGIDVWFNKKVKTGLKEGSRTAFLVYNENKPIAATVIKKDKVSKLCSMRILPEYQDKGLGKLLMGIIALELKQHAQQLYFTVPEDLWQEKELFFKKYGFIKDGLAHQQYRIWNQEFSCHANFPDVWRGVLQELPHVMESFTINGNNPHCDLVLSLKPQYAQRIIDGQKRVELRRQFSTKWSGTTAMVYASSPRQELIGEVKIEKVLTSSPQDAWNTWHSEIGCSQSEFKAYCQGTDNINILILGETKRYAHPVRRDDMENLIQHNLTSPQSYCKAQHPSWAKALSLNCLLQGML